MLVVILFSFLIGVVSGMRSMLAPAALAVAAWRGDLTIGGTLLGWFATGWSAVLFPLLCLGELIADKMPWMRSRKELPSFIFRVLSGAFCGVALATPTPYPMIGMFAGALGAVAGTLGGHAFRARMAGMIGKDFPAALLEDLLAIALAAAAIEGMLA